jgi:hypothetical protein
MNRLEIFRESTLMSVQSSKHSANRTVTYSHRCSLTSSKANLLFYCFFADELHLMIARLGLEAQQLEADAGSAEATLHSAQSDLSQHTDLKLAEIASMDEVQFTLAQESAQLERMMVALVRKTVVLFSCASC